MSRYNVPAAKTLSKFISNGLLIIRDKIYILCWNTNFLKYSYFFQKFSVVICCDKSASFANTRHDVNPTVIIWFMWPGKERPRFYVREDKLCSLRLVS